MAYGRSAGAKGLLLDLIETFQPLAHHAPVVQEGAHRFERVRGIYDNYMHALTLDELANVVSLSPYHFQRQFKAHFHVTPHQMLMAIRLWRAKAFSPTVCPPPKSPPQRADRPVAFNPRLHPPLRHYARALPETGRPALMRNLIQYARVSPSRLSAE